MASKFYIDGKKLVGLNVYTDVETSSALTSVYGETKFTENVPKQKKLALMRISNDSKTGTYTAVFGQPLEDIVNVINQLSTWVGDVEKAASTSTATQGVSTGSSDIYSQTYSGWVKVGNKDNYVSILGNQGNIKASGDVRIGGSFYSNGQLIAGMCPVARMAAIGFDTTTVKWTGEGGACYMTDYMSYDATKYEITLNKSGYYTIHWYLRRLDTSTATATMYRNGAVYVSHGDLPAGIDDFLVVGLHLLAEDILKFKLSDGTRDAWVMNDMVLEIMFVPE